MGYYVKTRAGVDSYFIRNTPLGSERWVCTNCGFAEDYVSEPSKLSTLDEFNMVNPSPAPEGPFR